MKDAWHKSRREIKNKKRKPLRKEQLVVGTVLGDPHGDKRVILRIEYPLYVLSHHGMHNLEGKKWTFNQLVELGDYIIERPKKDGSRTNTDSSIPEGN